MEPPDSSLPATGIVYVLTNPAMPGIVKIGRTARDSIDALLELMVVEDVTPELQREADEVDAESREGARRLEARRPPMNFDDMGIPMGARLDFVQGGFTCEVASPRRIAHEGEEGSLTALTHRLLGTRHAVQPSPHWTYRGRRLSDIHDETYESP